MFFRRLFNRGNSDETKRTVFIGSQAQLYKKKKFCSNSINTSKYNLFTFIFKFLFEQFQKYSNIFFLCISLLDQIPSVSPTGRFTTLTPFLIILAVSAVKEIIEDISRKRSDILINNKKTKVLRENGWKDEKWMNIKVGDIVRIESEQLFPADLFFLSSSEPNSICFLETANLDGETNLKIRQSLKDTSHLTTMESLRDDFNVELEYEQPNRNLYEFAGNLKMDRNKIVPIGPNQILLRGSRLCNTHWICGVVIYTGHETKLMKNSNKASLKRSQIDKKTNYQIFFLFMILVVIALMSAVLAEFWNRNQSPNHWYLGFEDDTDKFLYNFVTFILLYNNLIPISLSVTLEMVRFLQAFFINWVYCFVDKKTLKYSKDLEMYDEENDFFANARTSNLNEELGLVKYVFSDKTGTLTRNQMELKGCSIAGTSYGSHSHARADWNDLIDGLSGQDGVFIDEFLTLLSTCHTIIPEKNELDLYETKYQAASPDENAFVVQIKNMGIIFHTRLYDKLIIRFLNEDREYEILNVLEFNSVRKRMSVIIRDQNGVIKLYCKGADNVILARLSNKGQQFKDITLKHLEEFASEGLRTLVLAYKVISEAKYQEWNEIYKAAATSLDKRDEKIQAAAELIEKNLTVLGATAVEDKLQEGVPETIEKLKLAGINVWVLTGDKLETAVNIGFSCRLLNDETKLIYLIDDNDETDETLLKWFNYFSNPRRDENGNRFGLIIEGKAIESLLSDKWSEKFFKIATSCNVVICCRATPKNKAEVVDLIKYRTRDITLAIGDGANDVSMIRAAHVGIGICGREGTQALSASDYAIGQFRFLERLLFVHGTWNYKRVAKVILYSFYKNVCLYLIELWFALFNGFSGQILFDRWLIGLYNVIFTAIPPLALGLFDRPTKASTMIRFPELYSVEAKQIDFNMITFWASIANSVLHSAMLYFSSYAILHTEVAFSDGKIGDYIYMGNFVFTFCVIVVCLKAGLETDSWTIMSHISIWGSILAWILFLTVYSYAWPTFDVGIEMTRMVENVFRSGLFWMSLILVPVLILIIDVTVKTVQQTFFKTLFQKVRETEATDDEYSSNLFAFVSRNYSKKPMQIIRKLTIPIRYLGFAFSQEENGPVNQAEMVVRI